MIPRHRRPSLPERDGLFTGIALASMNVIGLIALGYSAEQAPATPAPTSVPDVRAVDDEPEARSGLAP